MRLPCGRSQGVMCQRRRKAARRRRSMSRLTSIELTSGETQTTPKVVAILKRVPGVRYIDIAILHADGRREEHHVPAADLDARWDMAERLQRDLDGIRGAGGDIRAISHLLDLLGD